MKVIFTIAGLQPEFGGPARSVPTLATALAGAGMQVELLTCASLPGRPAPLLPPAGLVTSHLLPHSSRTICWLARSHPFAITLRRLATASNSQLPTPVLVHDHGLWLPTNHAVAFAARTLNVPRIVSPRGMLTAWALQHRGLKKRLAWWLYQRRDLEAAQVLHATSAAEATAFHAAGLTQPIAIIPNGVALPDPNRKSEIGNRKSEIRTVLFLSRIHPVKGLLDLVHAWAKVRSQWSEVSGQSNWRVMIAGSDETGHLAEVKAEISQLSTIFHLPSSNFADSISFVGPVDGEAKWELYRSADLFVLPSHSENFGIVVAEALACGVPVITTQGTPWADLVAHRCGWWTDIGVEPLAAAVREAMALTDEQRREMGQRGRAWMERDFSWPGVAGKMKAVYEWMLGQEPRPNWVTT